MKNHFIFLMGIIILLATIWLATMAGINANKKAIENGNKSVYECFLQENNKNFDEF